MAVYRRSRRRYLVLLLVLTAVTLITLDRRSDDDGPLGAAGRVAHYVVAPVERAVSWVADPVGDWFEGVFDGATLKRDNERLRERLDAAEARSRLADSAIEENKQLKALLNLPISDDVERVTARVVRGSAGNFERTIVLDAGGDDGVVVDMPVVAAAGLVGRVIDVWPNGCEVLLLVDSRSGVGVRFVEQRVTGVAEGRAGARNLLVDLDDGKVQIAEGDALETSGLEGSTFPPNLPVGEVASVSVQPGGVGQRVLVAPYVDFARLEFVQVVKWAPGQGTVVTTTTSTTTTSTTTTTVPADGE